MKTIKPSKRGLTFSLNSDNNFQIGTRYDYTVDTINKKIIITPTEKGRLKVSKKKVGRSIKPLFDIRNKEVLSFAHNASSLKIETHEDVIVVHAFYDEVNDTNSNVTMFSKIKHSIHDVLGIKSKNKRTIAIPREALRMAAGGENFHQLSLDEFILNNTTYNTYESLSQSSKTTIENDIQDVFTVISLFSGAGMFDYPFAKDDSFEIIFACDYNKAATESYKLNIGNHVKCMDVRDLDGTSLPPVDLMLGSPSCKAHSNANRQKTRMESHDDVDLINEQIRLVLENNPNVFVVENVPSFLTASDGQYVKRIFDQLGDDYEISTQIVSDVDLGGYTTRKRAIIIGSKKEIGRIELPNIKILPSKTVSQALSKVDASWYNFNDISKSKPETINYMRYVSQGGNYKDIPDLEHCDSHSNRYKRLHPDFPSCTILNFRKLPLIHPIYDRMISVAEASALSGFDNHFRFVGTLDEKQQQCGNGVPYSLGNAIKNVIKKALCTYYANKDKQLRVAY